MDVIQDKVFRNEHVRMNTSSIYVRNAIEDATKKPRPNEVDWPPAVTGELGLYRENLLLHQPRLLFAFGAFAYEFARRANGENPERMYLYWRATRLGEEFRRKVEAFDSTGINAFPLLHVSIARGRFIQAHDYFCDSEGANYFEYAGKAIASLLLEHSSTLQVWIS